MQKRGQIISFDLVLGILIFILGLVFVLNHVDRLASGPAAELSLESDLVFNNLELNLKSQKYAAATQNNNFIDNYVIDEAELIAFKSLNYKDTDSNGFNDMKSLVVKNLNAPEFEMDFCLYFENGGRELVPVGSSAGIGGSSPNPIFLKANEVKCNDDIGGIQSVKASPYCPDYYTHAVNVFKPVIRKGMVMRMNILICAREMK